MKISLVVPVFNEQEAIPIFYKSIRNFEALQSYEVEIVFINDGSQDNTEKLIYELSDRDSLVLPLSFTRNFGKEAALMAGLTYATGDAVIPMDVDLQDPIEVIPQLIKEWQNGADMVLAKRIDRSSDTYLKRETAKLFYKFNNKISDLKIEENVGDFRLLSREIVEHIKALPERNLFMKGILSWVGGRTVVVTYERAKRSAGQTKFNGWKLWKLAMEGITSFSTTLLHIWTYIGMFVATGAFLYGGYRIVSKLLFGNDVPGYTSIMVTMLFLGGIELIGIGVLGEYIGRIYMESKQRPRYIIKKRE
ncbi:glycosyltransferase family 2 protein [uncultured Succiniclasticum sp.]|uniref:glycosyltransferase family 2 protein n=1 Tax=uncultured Succiniclasticum sp. TaxID=1500547 RepID=UPI00344ECA34